MIYISSIGSCVSRDIFNRKFISCYKDFFRFHVSQRPMSIISMMAKPIKYDIKKTLGSSMSQGRREELIAELEKNMLTDLIASQPDYIIIDFYNDVMFGAIQLEETYMTNRFSKFRDLRVFEDLKITNYYSSEENWDEFFSLWKKAIKKFIDITSEYLPNTKLIINKTRANNEILDLKNLEVSVFKADKYDVKKFNATWDKLDNYVINEYGLDYIEYENKYYLDENYLYGKGIVHFHNNYYQDYFHKLLAIILKDLKPKHEIVTNHLNLLINSGFEQGKAFWSNWSKSIEIVKTAHFNYIRAKNNNLTEDAKQQAWSNPIEINGDGTVPYTISFDYKIEDFEKVDSKKVIFSIRTFSDRNEYRYSKIIQAYDIKTDDITEQKNNEWIHLSLTIYPKGKYLKVAPILIRNGSISWKNIKVERNKTAFPYSKNISELLV